MILRTVTSLLSPRAQLYFVRMVYLFMFTMDIVRKGTRISLLAVAFLTQGISRYVSFFEFLCTSALWAFQKQMGFTFPFLNRIWNSCYNVLLQFSFIGSTFKLKCFHRKSILLGFLTLHHS